MGIATSLGLVINLLAWPVIAHGYPLFASIRAVENDSKIQMRKLVRYWTLFSLFSLFEFTFAKIIEWIPYWSSARLVVIFWLVESQFKGACLAYQGLVRPLLLVKPKEEKLGKREAFLNIIENYIQEYGWEALGKLIASEHKSQRCIDFQRNTKNIESEGEKSAATPKQLNEPNAARRDTEMLEATQKSAATKTNVKENICLETTPLKKTHQEWSCDLCKVTKVSKSMLNAHLHGSKHKSNLESFNASLLDAIETGPSPSSISSVEVLNGTHVIANVKEMTTPEASAENKCPETAPLKKTQQEWTSDLCKVTTVSESTLNAHLQGSKHKSKLESLKTSLHGAMDTGPSPLFQYEQSISYAEVLNGTHIIADVKEITTPEASVENKCPETTPLKKTQQEWTCDLCKVNVVSESTLNAHLQGSKHKSKLESLKASLLGAMDTGASPLDCIVISNLQRQVQHAQSVSAAWDLKGPHAAAEVKEIMPPKEMAEKRCLEAPVLEKAQQEWTCDLCKVTTTSEITLNSHLHGRKHKSKLETTLKASKLGAKDKGPSPSATRYLNDVNVAEKLIREKSGSKGKLIVSKTGHGECSNSHGDSQVLEPKEKYGPVASQQHANGKVKETKPPIASCTQNPPPKKAPREWKCNICKVTTTGEKMLNAHLEGSKHKSKFESLKASYLVGEIKDGEFPQQCILCKVKLLSDANVASHFEGKRHEFYMRLSQQNGETGGYKMIPETCRR